MNLEIIGSYDPAICNLDGKDFYDGDHIRNDVIERMFKQKGFSMFNARESKKSFSNCSVIFREGTARYRNSFAAFPGKILSVFQYQAGRMSRHLSKVGWCRMLLILRQLQAQRHRGCSLPIPARRYEAHLRRLVKIYRHVGVKEGALCLNLCSYELNSGGRLMEAAFKAAGAGVIPLGPISTPDKVQEAARLIELLKPDMINAYTNQLFDLFAVLGRKHSIRRCLVNGEPLWPEYRQRIEQMGRCPYP